MGLPQALERQQQAVFDRLGEPATWDVEGTPVDVRVRRPRDGDESFRMDYGQLVATATLIKVRASEVSEPVEGQVVQILDEETGDPVADARFEVSGEPKLDRRKGVWTCQVKDAPAAA